MRLKVAASGHRLKVNIQPRVFIMNGTQSREGPNPAYFLAINEAIRLLLESGQAPGWEKVDSASTALVARTTLAPICYAKIYFTRSPLDRLKGLVRGDRCSRAVDANNALIANGFKAPPVLFYGRAEGHPYMITRALPGMPLREFLRAQPADADALRLRRTVLRNLGTEVGRLHAAGFSHGDLRAGNVLIDTSEPTQMQISFLDNEGTERHRQLPEYWAIKNLAQLNMEGPTRATRTDRLRVFQAYCRQRGLPRNTQQRLLGEIIARTRRRLDENAAAREAD